MKITLEDVMKELASTSIVLRQSPIDGVGVFALKDIPRGARPFQNTEDWVRLPPEAFNTLPHGIKLLIRNYCLCHDGAWEVPTSLRVANLVCYMNHSDVPNVEALNNGEDFAALRDIHTGEELTLDYERYKTDRTKELT